MKIIKGAYYRYYTARDNELCILQVVEPYNDWDKNCCTIKLVRHRYTMNGLHLGYRKGEFFRYLFNSDRMTIINNDKLLDMYRDEIDAINKRWG